MRVCRVPRSRRVQECVLSRACVGQRAVGVEADVGIERGIQGVDARQVRLDQFDRRDLPGAHEPRQLGRGRKHGNRHEGQSM